jgi:superfamily II DNA or RNA helicase
MASFSRLYESLSPDPIKRGKQFERFVKWFLTEDPEWATQVAQVWLWEQYPDRWGRDCGIDLVFKHKNGEIWAVQAKCYSPAHEITKADIDKFLSESNRKGIDHRLLIATTDRIGANAKQVCEAQEKSVVRYHLSHFEDAAVDYPDSFDQLALGHRKEPPDPRLYQLKAIEEVCAGFRSADRGQLIMACGTGKTLVSMWVKERLASKRTLVLVPSLGLLSQIVNDWTSASRERFEVLCVCSDKTAGKQEEDEAIISVSDLSFPVTSDPSEIATFLNGSSSRVVFSTYQSSPLIADALLNLSILNFDLIVADEAHRCAGKVDGAFATVLDSAKLKASKRLFVTATPRTYSSTLKRKADEIGVEVVGMDDERIFGKRLHTLSFSEAIQQKLLTDYRVVIVGVDDATIADWIQDRRIVGTHTGIETDAQSLAAQIGLIKAIRDWNLQRIISFHNRVKRAEKFSQEISEVCAWLDYSHKPRRTIWSEHVSGEMAAITRRRRLRRLQMVDYNEVGILSNARCLSEGVDVPALDCVAFVDPRSSQIDIVQAVGRAIRLSESKQIGTIVVPVFIERRDDPEDVISSSKFKPIWDVLNALKAHDDVLANQLDQFRIELGSGARSTIGRDDLSKIIFDLPTSVNDEFAEALSTYLVTQTTSPWMFWYGLLQAFVNENGNCLVPPRYETPSGYRLGNWVLFQRVKQNRMPAERRARLDAINFVWDPRAAQWEEAFKHLEAFRKENGNCVVPFSYKTSDGYRLGGWVNRQRNRTISADRKARLDALGFIWDPIIAQWEEGFSHLKSFVKENGNCRIEHDHETSSGYRLGQWVCVQRTSRDRMPDERRKSLDSLGFIWVPYDDQWEQAFLHFKAFVDENNHGEISRDYRTSSGYPLGMWVKNQRKRQEHMSPERKARLDALGFLWNASAAQWEEGFKHLEEFVKKHGNCLVSSKHKTVSGYPLGAWVTRQRATQARMSADRKARLDSLEFVWSQLAMQWEEGFRHLEAFVKENGKRPVPSGYRTDSGYKLGQWVRVQHQRNDMPADRKARLEEIGFFRSG